MQLDIEFLRQHYAAMSDEELREINREDLVEAARRIYDDEIEGRKASVPAPVRRSSGPKDEEVELDWLDDAAEAYSNYVTRGRDSYSAEVAQARDVLEAAGIPAHMELYEEPGAEGEQRFRWRVLVPGRLIHRATSVLDRDIFNAEFEAQWKAHLEMLSDEELRVMEPQYAFCGLYDRLERIDRAYDEELQRRGLEE
jgi:hypothetical protein